MFEIKINRAALAKNQEKPMKMQNKVKLLREKKLMSKSELARKAGVSVVTIDRVERGEVCRLETMRKIILALGYTLEDRDKVFQEQG
jgi:DNA-binding XRE family transcriptional regulator